MNGEHVVRIEPLGADVVVGPGESVMGAAQRAGLRWPTVCGGIGECLVCRLRVLDGPGDLPPLTNRERSAYDSGRLPGSEAGTTRLACQFRPTADMTVFKAGVRRRADANDTRETR